jgi:hypothetical protein
MDAMIEPASVRVERKLEALRQELYKIVNKSSQNSITGISIETELQVEHVRKKKTGKKLESSIRC